MNSNSKYILNLITSKLNEKIYELFHIVSTSVNLAMPTDKTKADLVITDAFTIAKSIHQSPIHTAEEIVRLANKDKQLAKYAFFSSSSPGFINIRFKDEFLSLLLGDVIRLSRNYGKNDHLKNEVWVIEHTSPNPNKAMHLGHLRNNLIGMAIARICEANGAKVIYDAVDNNRGIAIVKAMWGYLVNKRKDGKRIEDISYWYDHQDEWVLPEEVKQKADHFVGDCYLLGSEEFKSSVETEKVVRELSVKWEQNDKLTLALWGRVLEYAHQGIQETLTRLDNRWDNIWHEHEHYKKGKNLVEEGLQKGIFRQLDSGAVLTNLEKYSLPDTIVLKSDGTSLYITQDLALTKLKKDKFKADKLIWVVGPEQSLALKQLFAVCEQLGIGKLNEFDHISYGLVNVQTESGEVKKMSSRGGEVILIDQLIAKVKDALLNLGRNYTKDELEDIALGAIKLAVLKPARNSSVIININNAISLDGDSGVYLLYTFARMKSLVAKATHTQNYSITFTNEERVLTLRLLYFPMLISNSMIGYTPNLLVEYLFELAHLFNSLYASTRFITENAEETNKKILLTTAVLIVFSNAFVLLGVKPLDKI